MEKVTVRSPVLARLYLKTKNMHLCVDLEIYTSWDRDSVKKLYHFSGFTKNSVNLVKPIFRQFIFDNDFWNVKSKC